MRLQKFMAECGIGSRRACEKLIAEGAVSVDGQTVTEMGVKIDVDKSVVMYKGRCITPNKKGVYIALHKPVGYITTSKDQFGRANVMDLLCGVMERVFPVGRLDYDSSGLLLLTNDGDFAYRMTHPSHSVYKKYVVSVKGLPSAVDIDTLRTGVMLDGVITQPAVIESKNTSSDKSTFIISIKEGRNRQVRKMFDAVGHPVTKLHRIAVGGFELGSLKCGKFRYLYDEEVRGLICLEKL